LNDSHTTQHTPKKKKTKPQPKTCNEFEPTWLKDLRVIPGKGGRIYFVSAYFSMGGEFGSKKADRKNIKKDELTLTTRKEGGGLEVHHP